MVRHVVLFQFAEGTTDAQIDDYERSLRAYVAGLDGVLSYEPARDAGINPGTYSYSVVATFTDDDAFRAYFDGDEHKAIQRNTADMMVAKASSQSRFG